jgi:excinuclease UvrABC nuclease subunit
MIFVDTSEPDDIAEFIAQSVPVTRESLNNKLVADYFFLAADSHRVQVNRTQAGELLGNIDSFEDELRRYYNSAEETYAIIEGIISPYKISNAKMPTELSIRKSAPAPGALYAYAVSTKGWIYREQQYHISNKMFKAWLYQIDKAGISVVYTINDIDTAASLVAIYENSQKTEHQTLQRYLRPRISVRTHNKHVQALINLSSAYRLNIGEVKAKALIDEFGTLGAILLSDPQELCRVNGIGMGIAEGLLKAIGDTSE